MLYRQLCLTVTLFLGVSAHSLSEAPVEAELVSNSDEIAALESKWSDMFAAKDLDGVMALMAENSVLIFPGSPPIVGLEGIRKATKAMLMSDDTVSWASDFAFIAPSGDMAYDYGTATTKSPDGSIIEGHYLVVWVKESDGWKVAADMFN
ncbi:MAG: nuclear transport factor 2 family protein [Halieaceae bacterium]